MSRPSSRTDAVWSRRAVRARPPERLGPACSDFGSPSRAWRRRHARGGGGFREVERTRGAARYHARRGDPPRSDAAEATLSLAGTPPPTPRCTSGSTSSTRTTRRRARRSCSRASGSTSTCRPSRRATTREAGACASRSRRRSSCSRTCSSSMSRRTTSTSTRSRGSRHAPLHFAAALCCARPPRPPVGVPQRVGAHGARGLARPRLPQ